MPEIFRDVLAAHAAVFPDRTALIFTTDPARPDEATRFSYAELDAAARALGHRLSRTLAPGERALLLFPPGPDFTVAFLGCQYAGVIAVPAPPPDGFRRQRDRLAGIAEDAGVRVVLTVSALLEDVREWAGELVLDPAPEVVAVDQDENRRAPGEDWTPPPSGPADLAFLQYTSGSTSRPKGVEVDQVAMAAQCLLFAEAMGLDERDTYGGWLPNYHDFGLIGQILTPLHRGITTVGMPALAFVRRPVSWLRMISTFGVTVTPAPNFAFDLSTQRVRDQELEGIDLSRLRLLINGSEPIRARTMREFADRFAAAGLAPAAMAAGYGLAEATLCVTLTAGPLATWPVQVERLEQGEAVTATGVAGEASRELVDCGPARGCEIAVVEAENGQEQPDGQVGEIWVRGPSVCGGYWGNPEETALTFGYRTPDGREGWMRTGDLGVVRDRRLYVTGRIKEVLMMGGRNLYPQDLEADARTAHEWLGRGVCAAFTVEAGAGDEISENLVVVAECRAAQNDPAGLLAVASSVRQVLSREAGIAASVVLVRPNSVPRTTSGKIQRGLSRELFLSGDLPVVHESLTPAVRRRVHPREEGTPVPAGAAGGEVAR